MKKLNYWELLKKSFSQVFRNLVLAIPWLFSLVLLLGFSLLLAGEALVFVLINKAALKDITLIFSGSNLVLVVFFALADLVVLIALGSYVRAMQLGMLREIVRTGKTSLDNMFSYGRQYLEAYFKFTVIRILIYLIPLIVFGALGFLSFTISPVLGGVVSALLLLVYLGYVVLVALGLFFMEPMITSQKVPVVEIVKRSFHYLKKDFWHVFYTWGITVLLSLAVGLVLSPLSLGPQAATAVGLGGVVFGGIALFAGLIRTIVQLLLKLWMDIFVFQSYFGKNR